MLLVAMIDFLEMLRRTGDMKDVSALLIAKITRFRLLFVTERIHPVRGARGRDVCYLNLSRRLELVVARSAGISLGKFIAPALVIAMLIGIAATTFTIRCRPSCVNGRCVWKRRFSTRTVFRGPAETSGCASAATRARPSSARKSAGSRASELGGVSVSSTTTPATSAIRIEARSAYSKPGIGAWKRPASTRAAGRPRRATPTG